jgi:hypothetical protein
VVHLRCGKPVHRGKNGRKRNWRIAFREHRRRLTEESVSATHTHLPAAIRALTASRVVRRRVARRGPVRCRPAHARTRQTPEIRKSSAAMITERSADASATTGPSSRAATPASCGVIIR